MSVIDILKSRRLIPLGPRKISRLGEGRYVVYLPIELNYIWKELNERDVKVKVYIELES